MQSEAISFEMEHVASNTASINRFASSCLRYAHEVMGCQWHPIGYESLSAFLDGDYLVLEYIHAHGGPLSPKLVEAVHPRNAGFVRLLGDRTSAQVQG